MSIVARTPSATARTFNWLTIYCLVAMLLGFATVPLHVSIIYLLPIALVGSCLMGLTYFQMGYPAIVAVLLAIIPSIPYVGSLAFLALLVNARYYLQSQNYTVSFLGACINSMPTIVAPIRWAESVKWFAVLAVVPVVLFIGIWVMNSEYADKFFQPVGASWWIGPSCLLIAGALCLLTLPLMIEIQRVRTMQEKSISRTLQFFLINLLIVVFFFASCGFIALTPAAITMCETMGIGHD